MEINGRDVPICQCDTETYRVAFNITDQPVPEQLTPQSDESRAKLISLVPEMINALVATATNDPTSRNKVKAIINKIYGLT